MKTLPKRPRYDPLALYTNERSLFLQLPTRLSIPPL